MKIPLPTIDLSTIEGPATRERWNLFLLGFADLVTSSFLTIRPLRIGIEQLIFVVSVYFIWRIWRSYPRRIVMLIVNVAGTLTLNAAAADWRNDVLTSNDYALGIIGAACFVIWCYLVFTFKSGDTEMS